MRQFYLIAVLSILLLQLRAQSITITPNGIKPAPVVSTPALDYDDIIDLPSPKNGDRIYDLTYEFTRTYFEGRWMPIFEDRISKESNMRGILSAGSTQHEAGNGVGSDSIGNIYVLTDWENSNFFGGGKTDVVISKYDQKGNEIWFIAMVGPEQNYGLDLVTDISGNVYVTGIFETSITFNGKNGNVTKNAVGNFDIFVVKYNSNGVIQWVQTAGGIGSDLVTNLALDKNGNVFITGSFTDSANFGTTQKTSTGGTDMFIAKYNSSGVMQWVQAKAGSELGLKIAVHNNDVYVAGNPTLVKYNTNGVFQWEKDYEVFVKNGMGLGVDSNGNVYLGGVVEREIIFENTTIKAEGLSDLLLAKYSSDGTFQKVTTNKSPSDYQHIYDMGVDTNGNVFMTGTGSPNFSFANMNMKEEFGFIGKFDTDGNPQWGHSFKYQGTVGRAITVCKKNQIYVVGTFIKDIYTGGNSFNTKGGKDAFVSLLDF